MEINKNMVKQLSMVPYLVVKSITLIRLSEQGREPTKNLNPQMRSDPGFESGPHWWESSALITAPLSHFSSLC